MLLPFYILPIFHLEKHPERKDPKKHPYFVEKKTILDQTLNHKFLDTGVFPKKIKLLRSELLQVQTP